MSSQEPSASLPTAAEIFRQALEQNAELHKRALEDMQRHTNDVRTQLQLLTNQRMQSLQMPNFGLVRRAVELQPAFWNETVNRAITVLQQHGEFPAEEEPSNESDAQAVDTEPTQG